MRTRAVARVAVICALTVAVSSCGWLFTSGPPAGYENLPAFSCTQSRTAPVLDVVWGALIGGTVANAYAIDDEWKHVLLGFYGPWAVLSGLSARSGFNRVKACQQAIASLQGRSRGSSVVEPQHTGPEEMLGWRPPLLLPGPQVPFAPTAIPTIRNPKGSGIN